MMASNESSEKSSAVGLRIMNTPKSPIQIAAQVLVSTFSFKKTCAPKATNKEQHASRKDLRMKQIGIDTPCHEREDAHAPHTKHHQNLANRNLLGDGLDEGVFNGEGSH